MRAGVSFVFPVEIMGFSLESTEVGGELASLFITIENHFGMVGVEFNYGFYTCTTDGRTFGLPFNTFAF